MYVYVSSPTSLPVSIVNMPVAVPRPTIVAWTDVAHGQIMETFVVRVETLAHSVVTKTTSPLLATMMAD